MNELVLDLPDAARGTVACVRPDRRSIAILKIVEDGTGKIWMIDADRGSATPFAVDGAN